MNLFSAQLTNRFISITGPDALRFLQGQASCDLNELNEKAFSYGTLNTPKGRIYCLFKALKTKDGLLLSMNESLLDSTLQKLSKYAVFFKCELKEDLSFEALGITSDDNKHYGEFLKTINLDKEIVSNCINENDTFWLNISSQKNLCEVWIKKDTAKPSSLGHSKAISNEDWQALVTNCGIPEIYNSSQDEFILQFINLQQLGAVSFKKGCYTGQEIIARMKFLGKQKKMAFLLHSEEKCIQEPLASAYKKEGTKCGTLIRSHWSEKTGSVALCILPIESALSLGEVFFNDSLDLAFSVTEIDYSEYKK
jgi:folate-binding protein YgfZ